MTSLKTLAAAMVTAALLFLPAASMADDIDLYTGGEQITGVATNVLIVLDNTSNFSATNQGWTDDSGANTAQGAIEAQVLIDVLKGLPRNSLNVGLMQYADKGGGYPIFAIRENSQGNLTVFEAVNIQIRSNVGDPAYKGPTSGDYDELMNSVFRYFNGFVPQAAATSGRSDESQQGDLRDFAGNASPVPARASLGNHGYAAAGANPLASFAKPADVGLGCAKNFIIFIGNGYPSKSSTSAKTRLTQAGALFSPAVTPQTSGNVAADLQGQVAPYWARFMRQFGVKSEVDDPAVPGSKVFNPIQTYTIDVCKNQCSAEQKALLEAMAQEGRGRYFRSTSKDEMSNALKLIFAEIQAVNSQFAAAALPVSVNARGTFENQVYIGVFRPDSTALPRWYGNLKGYKFAGFCDWDQDGIVDIGEQISDEVGNQADACRKYCDIDRDGAFDPEVDVGVNDPREAESVCGAVASSVRNPGDLTPADSTDAGSFLVAGLESLPIERYDIFLSDRNNALAEDQTTGTGFIRQDAVSYWTHASDFWNFLQTTASAASDSPDGPNVERGGAAQRLRDQLVDTGSVTPQAYLQGRRSYTCLSPDCTPGTSLGASSTHRFSTDNATLVSRLTRTASSFALGTLTRVGDTVTVTAPNHTLANGTQISLSGVTPSAYNLNPVTVANAANVGTPSASFQFTADGLEQPPVLANGQLSVATPRAITSLVVEGGRAKAFADTTGLSAGDQVSVAGAGPFFDGTASVVAVDPFGAFFTFGLKIPAAATSPGSTTAGPKVYSNLSVQFHPTEPLKVLVRTGTNLTGTPETGRFAFGSMVTLNGVDPAFYSGNRVVVDCARDSQSYCYAVAAVATSPATYLKAADRYDVELRRALGSTAVTARFVDTMPAGLTDGTAATIDGTGETQYDRTVAVGGLDLVAKTFTFGPVVLSPSNGSGGTATVVLGRYVSPATLINWVRGQENGVEDENKDGFTSGWRASVHGDVLHSRPLMLNYDDRATTAVELGIVGFYGANDGFLRAIKAGTEDSAGVELWSFTPEEFIPDPTSNDGIKRIFHNDTPVLYPNLACDLKPQPAGRPYFWDGVISSNGAASELMNDKRIIYATMRRGGHAVYALDVSNPVGNTDAAQFVPTFAWKVSNSTPGFANLGQTWSEARVFVLKTGNAANPEVPVLAMGGGYDPTQDDRPPGASRGSGSSIGRGVYLIDPERGPGTAYLHLLPEAGATQYSMPADVTTLDSDGDGYVDRIYALDSGGNVFRWSYAGGDPFSVNSWQYKWVANLTGTGVDARKFLARMAVMPITYKTKPGYALLFGSGDREKPLPNYRVDKNLSPPACVAMQTGCAAYYPEGYFGEPVQDRFFSVLDIDDIPTDVSGAAEFTYPLTITNLHRVVTAGTVASYDDSLGRQGWYLDLLNNQIKLVRDGATYSCPRGEEKQVDVPVFSGGFVRFATNSPVLPDTSRGVCTNLGQAREYAINPLTGLGDDVADGATFDINNFSSVMDGGGLPPSITSGVVQIGERYVKFETRGAGDTQRDPVRASSRRNKVYWFYRAD